MDRVREGKAGNGGTYIDGVPMLRWGEWTDNSYCGCVTALLEASGTRVSYEDVMGLSGVCYQAIMRDDWDPSSQMPQNGLLCEDNVGDALGISVYTLDEGKGIREQAKRSIEAGFPVLLVGGRWAPEWTLACGYAVENGDCRFFGRTYFDCQSRRTPEKVIEGQPTRVAENEIYTSDAYFHFSGFPGVYPRALTRFYDVRRDPVSRKQALRVSLETCLAMFEQSPGEHHRYGYDAYDVLIRGFELDNADYQAKCGCADYHIGSMQDARRAASVFLEKSADVFDGKMRAELREAAGIYRKMLDNLLAAVPYERTTAVFGGNSSSVWDRAQRRELTEALRANKDLEKGVRVVVAGALAHM
jgi:hypothetical protein